jgi:hypothetical protein
MKQSSDLKRVLETGDRSKNKVRMKGPIMGQRNFLRNICFASWVVAGIVLFTGCDNVGNIDIVKRSILSDIDHSLSIGDALDKYKYFTRTEWTEFETDNGRKVVEFKGYYNMWDGVLRVQFILNKDLMEDEDGLSFRVGYMEVGLTHYNGSRKTKKCDYYVLGEIYKNEKLHMEDVESWRGKSERGGSVDVKLRNIGGVNAIWRHYGDGTDEFE